MSRPARPSLLHVAPLLSVAASWASPRTRQLADDLRASLAADAAAAVDAHGPTGAAKALGVSRSALHAWRHPGRCLA